ncbi:MAG TPA: alanine--glyoxylate aminotransferase family protein [Anaerolineae bacterium]
MQEHVKLFIPGPIEVRESILQAQVKPMIGHRGKPFEQLFSGIQSKLRTVFNTSSRVLVSTSSGTGLWEGAARNCITDDPSTGVLATVCGAFSERWADVFERNGKTTSVIKVAEGKAIKPDMVRDAIKVHHGKFDAIAIVHNETSTGVMNPLTDIVQVIRELSPGTLILVDAVSSLAGVKIDFDLLGIDVLLTSSQKCFGLPPGLAFAAVSDRALERARHIKNRGYYFDFVELDNFLQKNNTPATPAISLLNALEQQLSDMLAEGLENRYARHAHLAEMTRNWAISRGYAMFAEPGFESPTVTCVSNSRKTDISAMNKYLATRHLHLSDGYGGLKGKTFRIAHMADLQESDMKELFGAIDDFLAK